MELIITSILAFVSTNIDDVFLLMLFFGNKRFRDREIIVGQFLGIATLIGASVVLSFIGLVVDQVYIGLLGFVPMYFGVRQLIQLFAKTSEEEETIIEGKNKNNILTVSGVTIANGGDNIGIYVPLFATLVWSEKITMTAIFFIMTALWCVLAKYLAKHPMVAKVIDRYGHLITPFVLIFLGLYILYESGTFGLVVN